MLKYNEQLQHELYNTLDFDIKIIIGNINAELGADNELYNKAMGEHDCWIMNENDERLTEFVPLTIM